MNSFRKINEHGRKVIIECILCGDVMPSVYRYHKHNIRQHSPAQLSRAVLKLRNMKMPLNDPGEEESEDEEEEEEHGNSINKGVKDLSEALGLPVKVEAMDEVIELGPTDSADNLQVQSRLVKNSRETGQKPSQVIELKESFPPPCHINPLVEDPDAIIVKFNRDMVMAQDKCGLSASTPGDMTGGQPKRPKVQLRAVAKNTIPIPNRNAFIMDYKKAQSRSTDKYIMQNVSMLEPSPKRRRGRPRKNQGVMVRPTTKPVFVRKEEVMDEFGEEDEDGIGDLADPPLFSDDEDEEDESASVPNVTRTRSGRAIKMKTEDEAYKYYDMPGKDQMDVKDSSIHKEHKAASVPSAVKESRNAKQTKTSISQSSEETSGTSDCNKEGLHNAVLMNDRELLEVVSIKEEDEVTDEYNVSVVNEELMAVDNSSEYDKSSVSESFEGFECFLCFKVFSSKESCEKHLEEHFHKVEDDTESSECNAVNDKEISLSKINASPSNKDEVIGDKKETPDITANHDSSKTNEPSVLTKESFICSVCSEEFDSQLALQNHTHDSNIECKFCGKAYQNRINLQSHVKRYHENTEWMKFKCSTCGKNFGFLTALERHMKEHNPNQKFCCEQCGKVFKNLTNLKNHIPLHTKNEVFECPYCPKKYYIKYSYEKHVKSHINLPKFHCDICDKSFNEKKYFEIHVQRHQTGGCLGRSKDYRCNNCGDIKTPSELELVTEIDCGHHKTCLVCGKGLYKRYMIENLDPLALQAKQDKPREQCKICGKCVLNLPRHMKNAHLDIAYVPCDICGVVVTKASLPAHKNRKHGGSAVTCDHCNRVFKNIMCLREHMTKVRKKEDPAKNVCKFCKKIIPPDHWKEHMSRHRTKCNDCGATNFQNHMELLAHLEICRKCSNCGTTQFTSREEYLDHIEVCSSNINIMTGALDSPNNREAVTSIFAIVDESTCCETCGEVFEDQVSLAHHITEAHPNTLPTGRILDDSAVMEDIEAILYACPQESCGVIVSSKDSLKEHVATVHNTVHHI